jgi:ankyrin repeat protein
MSDALQALFSGNIDQARELLPPEGQLSVFEAAAFGAIERLRTILEADPNEVTGLSDDGFTALHLAVFAEQEDAARLLLECGADVNALSGGAIARVPPLGTAAFVRSAELARLLLDAGANVNGQGEGGFTALHAAAQNGDEDLVQLLLERGADPSLPNRQGKCPGDLAANDRLRRLLTRS